MLSVRAEIEMEFYYQNASSADAKLAIPIGGTMSKQKIQWLASWLDFASIMLFLLAAVFIVLYQQHVLIEVASRTVTVVDYSVQVWDLPQVSPRLSMLLTLLWVHASPLHVTCITSSHTRTNTWSAWLKHSAVLPVGHITHLQHCMYVCPIACDDHMCCGAYAAQMSARHAGR